tara:strand:- start:79 stop:777 length:699 start_codon:yes stop_codon:yes gene_type:complete
MKKMNRVEFVQTTINSSDRTLNQWSKELSVSRQTIYNWLGNIHVNIRKIYINRIADIAGKKINWDNDNNLIVSDKTNVVNNKNLGNSFEKNQSSKNNDLNDLNDNLQRQLQLSITKYEHAFNTSRDPMAVVVNNNYTSMNIAMEKLLGIKKRRDLFGVNIYDTIFPSLRKEKKERREGKNAIGKFEHRTAFIDADGKRINGNLSVTRFWLPTNNVEKILCSIMTFYPDSQSP